MTKLDSIEAAIRATGCTTVDLFFTGHRGGHKFALSGVVISADDYQRLQARFTRPPVTVDADADAARRRNRLHAIADARDGGKR